MSLSKIFVNNTQIVGVDNEPTAGSKNLVESGGVYYSQEQIGNEISVNDESAYLNPGGYINTSGAITDNNDCKYTDFIPVNEGDIFRVSGYIGSRGILVAGYSSNTEASFTGALVSGGGTKTNVEVVIPLGVTYIRACSAFIAGYKRGSLAAPIKDYVVEMTKTVRGEYPNTVTKLLSDNSISTIISNNLNIAIETSTEGYCRYDYDLVKLKFKSLVVKDTVTGIYFYLTDGTHNSQEDNEIAVVPTGIFYIEDAIINSGAKVQLHCDNIGNIQGNFIPLGCAERGNRFIGGLIGDICHYTESNESLGDISLIKEKTFRVSDIGLLSGFYRSDTGEFRDDTLTYRSIKKLHISAKDNIKVCRGINGVYCRALFWNGTTFIGTELNHDGIFVVPDNVTDMSLTFATESTGWENYTLEEINLMSIKISPCEFEIQNDTFVNYLPSTNGIVLSDNGSICLVGASFSSPANKWFELGCSSLGQTPINKGRDGGISILDTANEMANGTCYSASEFETFEIFVIMHVLNYNVIDETNIKEKVTDYTLPFGETRTDATIAAAFDYVIKKYMAECYNAKNNSSSRWYNTQMGKPCQIVLCTSWHDARVKYNKSIRQLAAKWRLPLITFDANIGFTKNSPYSETGEQISKWYCTPGDYETINGISYGWHPARGINSFIQKKMATIFEHQMKK